MASPVDLKGLVSRPTSHVTRRTAPPLRRLEVSSPKPQASSKSNVEPVRRETCDMRRETPPSTSGLRLEAWGLRLYPAPKHMNVPATNWEGSERSSFSWAAARAAAGVSPEASRR